MTISSNVSSYAHLEVLVETDWLEKNLRDPSIRIIEVDYDPEHAYKEGHISGAYLIWWKRDINDPIRRDIISKRQFEQLLPRIGATRETELVLYGDFNSWFAAFAFWVFEYYGHRKIRLLNGGRKKWEAEGRRYTTEEPLLQQQPSAYIASPQNEGIRAYIQDVQRALEKNHEIVLVDVRIAKRIQW